jgi:hypothetical protein
VPPYPQAGQLSRYAQNCPQSTKPENFRSGASRCINLGFDGAWADADGVAHPAMNKFVRRTQLVDNSGRDLEPGCHGRNAQEGPTCLG